MVLLVFRPTNKQFFTGSGSWRSMLIYRSHIYSSDICCMHSVLDQTRVQSLWRRSVMQACPLTGSSFFSRPEELKCSSISLSGNPHPQNYRSIPFLCLSGNRTSRFAMSKVDHWALESPRPDGQSMLTFLFPLSEISLS
jgi:hypothetical protein